MERDEEEISSPETRRIEDLEEEDRLSAVSNSSLNLEDDEGSRTNYSPVSSEKKSESDMEEGEILGPIRDKPVISSPPPRLPRHRKKRKKEPLDVEINKHFGSKRSDLPRYDVRNIIKYKKKKKAAAAASSSSISSSHHHNHHHQSHHHHHSSSSLPLSSSMPPQSSSSSSNNNGNHHHHHHHHHHHQPQQQQHHHHNGRRPPSPSRRPPSPPPIPTSRHRRRSPNSRNSSSRRSRRSREKDPPISLPPLPPSLPLPSSSSKKKRKKSSPSATSSPIKGSGKTKKTKKTSLGDTKKKTSKKSSSSSSCLKTPITIVNSHSSSVADKEVFTAGDKIMVSVSFKPSRMKPAPPSMDDDEILASPPRGKEIAANTSSNSLLSEGKKPVVIDVMSSPYLVIEPSPQETIDILSDEENDNVNSSTASVNTSSVINNASSSSNILVSSPPTPPPAPQPSSAPIQSTAASSSSSVVPTTVIEVIHHKGPCTPPIEESIDVSKGPQTPSDTSYDPCNPTLSPTCDDDLEPDDFHVRDNGVSSSQNNWTDSEEHIKEPATSSISFFDSVGGGASGVGGSFFTQKTMVTTTTAASTTVATTTTSVPSTVEKLHKDSCSKDPEVSGSKDYSTVDMDMDSPFSPQSSDMSDIFEPPLNTPLTNKLLQKKSKSKFASKAAPKKPSTSNNNRTSSKNLHGRSVQMKLIDDKLRIVDDVPTSAVEMAVKEKFLKKVQRQERIVEEIKMVLKPYYNRKKIDKESYKDILRKCVPKVCHSKNGEINPIKIQKLVKGYIRKYKYHSKKNNKAIKG